MAEPRPYYIPSSTSSKSNTKRQNNTQQQSNYEALLSHFSQTKSNSNKITKAQTSIIQYDKYYVQQLQQQITDLKEQVNFLALENQRLKQSQDKSLKRIKEQYHQLTKFSNIVQLVQQLKIENLALKQNVQSLKLDFNIQMHPLRQLYNHILQIPKQQINDIMQLRLEQQETLISQQKCKVEVLNLERTQLLELCSKQEGEFISYLENKIHT
ncbi:unnamed protein product (macronuclear) [Paramecium tetraurelia]|uniref:Uncharacterized protein n=1 Tax=Paramecium tetraurelia TaxID=5888 RepID=A0D596_PARTE|nr:uncharacterized protein GSPATT00013660001 [Paramecium tetraurelia]CAK78213.1 unnamed protein product [Paramecium tetraurelia]|eukprot:XP_001445610.1 hypothetical protein (macronuclear) [Paramecium tetraurelia strain d4-2]